VERVEEVQLPKLIIPTPPIPVPPQYVEEFKKFLRRFPWLAARPEYAWRVFLMLRMRKQYEYPYI